MAYRNRSKRAKRPAYRRKRYTGKRSRSVKNYTKPDGWHREKINYQQELVVSAATGSYRADCTISWFRTKPNASGAIYPCGSATNTYQFLQCLNMYKEYQVVGFRLKYTPFALGIMNDIDTRIRPMSVGTQMMFAGPESYPLEDNKITPALDFKQYDFQKPFKRYYHVAKWGEKHEINWRNTAEAWTNTYGDLTPDCKTQVSVVTDGIKEDYSIGQIQVTYYFRFRSRQSDVFLPPN